jgi:hypothetical protein
MQKPSNLNKFKNSQQILKNFLGLYFVRKKNSRTHKGCLNKLFCLKIFTTNTLVANVYKMFKCDNN